MTETAKELVDTNSPISVSAAPKRGETFQGNPCKRGHSGVRYRKGGTCVECAKDFAKAQKIGSSVS